MKELLCSTTAYRFMARDAAHATLAVFPDAKYLRALLKECAKAFFGQDGRKERLIEEETYSDCLFFPAAGAKLTVDDAARMIDESLLRPVEENKKLFVLDAFDAASQLVQNKLLKVMEEPPEGVYFLLGATSEGAVLPTVLSRVRKVVVAPFSEEQILSALERSGVEGDRARAAAASGGVYSLAEELITNSENFAIAEALMSGKNAETLCRKAGEKKDKGALFAALALTVRDMLLYRTGQEKYVSLKSNSLKELAQTFSEGALLAAADFVKQAERETQFNATLAQCLYTFVLRVQKEKAKWQRLS